MKRTFDVYAIETRESPADLINDIIEQTYARHQFEINDQYTRYSITREVRRELEQMVSNRKIYNYQIICDNTNNPLDLIDRGELAIMVYYEEFYSQIAYVGRTFTK
jgi:phage tail sheath protein FI